MLDQPPNSPKGSFSIGGFVLGLAVAAILAIVAFYIWQRGGLSTVKEKFGADFSLAAVVAEQTAPLNVKQHTVELVTDKSKKAADALRRGDYQTAGRIADEVLARSAVRGWQFQPLNRFMATLTHGNDAAFLETVNRWIQNDPRSATAYLIRAKYNEETGWATRGKDVASTIKSEHMTSFMDYMRMATADAEKSIEITPNNPLSYFTVLHDVSGNANSPEMDAVFRTAIARFPGYYELYRLRLYSLTPKWGGSTSAMYAFVEQYAGHAPENSPLKLLYVQLYAYLLDAAWFDCHQPKVDDRKRCADSAMSESVTPALEQELARAMNLYKASDPIELNKALWPILGGMVDTAGASDAIGAALQAAATAAGSDTQLIRGTGRNNYLVDDLTAQVWAMMGNPANAEQKFREALRDVEQTAFADEEEKDVVLGKIYDDMTQVARNASQYVNIIVYHDAANTVAGANHGGVQYFKCFAYFKLNRYQEAVDECTRILETNGDSMLPHYYRARANEALKNWDAALKEFEPIADGEDNYIRVGAAIDMDHIHALRGDYAGSLAILNKYTYLFDESIQPADDLAISYNNRCFAYMKLGQLQNALDDCNASLRYGRLPDALHKQQELLKLLNGSPPP
jgi:tetratricopeptide (TPR) repeat protein